MKTWETKTNATNDTNKKDPSFLSSRTTQVYHYISKEVVFVVQGSQTSSGVVCIFLQCDKNNNNNNNNRRSKLSTKNLASDGCVFVSSLLGAEQQQQQPWRRPRPLPRLRALVSREPCSWMKWPFICILSFVSCWHWEWHGFVVPFPGTYSLATTVSRRKWHVAGCWHSMGSSSTTTSNNNNNNHNDPHSPLDFFLFLSLLSLLYRHQTETNVNSRVSCRPPWQDS